MAEEQEASFRLRLSDEVEGAADTAREALDRLKKSMDADTKSIDTLNKAMRRMKGEAVVDQQVFKSLSETLKKKRGELAASQAQYLRAGGSIQSLGSKTPSATRGFAALQAQAQRMGGPIGALAGGLARLQAFVEGSPMRAGVLALAGAVTVLGVATLRATKQLYEYANAQANARRSEALRLEGLSKVRSYLTLAYKIGETSGKDLQTSLDRVSAKVPIARAKIAGFQEQLYNAGLRGKQLDSALEGMSIKAAAQGDAQAGLFAQWAQIYNFSGRSVDSLTNKVKSRLGGIVKAQMLDVNVQAEKLQENFAALFRNVNIDGLLKAKAEFNALFSQALPSGRVLSRVLTSMQQTLVNGATTWRKALTTAIEYGILGMLKLESFVLHARLGWALLGQSAGKSIKAIVDGVGDIGRAVRKMRDALFSELDQPFRDMTAATQAALAAVGALAVKVTLGAVPALTTFARQLVFTTVPAVYSFARTLVTTTLPALARMAWAMVLQTGPAMLNFARALLFTGIPALLRYATAAWTAARGVAAAAAPIILAVAAMWGLYKIVELLYVVWKEIDWKDLGRSILTGIGAGIDNAKAWLFDKVGSIADGIKKRFASLLGISSPSKVFADLGVAIPQGLVVGIKKGTPGVQGAVDGMMPDAKTPGGGGGAGAAGVAPIAGRGGGASASVVIRELHVHAGSGGADTRQIALSLKAELERILQGVAFELGASEDPA
jgi:hypothetical protein